MRILLCLPHTHPASWEFDTLTPFQSFVASLVEWGGAVGTWVVVTVPHSLLALGQKSPGLTGRQFLAAFDTVCPPFGTHITRAVQEPMAILDVSEFRLCRHKAPFSRFLREAKSGKSESAKKPKAGSRLLPGCEKRTCWRPLVLEQYGDRVGQQIQTAKPCPLQGKP